MSFLRCFLSAALLLLLNGPINAGEAPAQDFTKRVLLLNSYHPGYAWSDGLQSGIIETFQKRNPNWLPRIEYLDCKRFPDGKHLEQMVPLLHLKYQRLALVVAMDDPALEFVLRNRTRLFVNTPVLFCGINYYTPDMIRGHSLVTGRVQNNDIAGTIELMLRLHPHAREIVVIHDYTNSGMALRRSVEALVSKWPSIRFRSLDRMDLADVLKELDHLPRDSLVLDLGLITDKTGRIFSVPEITNLFAKHSPVPVYGAFETMLGKGIVGGRLIGAKVHGNRTAAMALRILAGENPSQIPVETESDARFMFDYAALSRFSIPLSALPENSIVINRPVSFYAMHRSVILLSLSAIAVLWAIIALLAANIAQRRRATGALSLSEERFRLAFENANEGVCLVDKDGRLLKVNKRMCDILGYEKKELEGAKVGDFALGEGMDESREFLKQGISGKLENSVSEERYFHKEGHLIYTRVSSSAVRDSKGEILYFISHVQDITERKKAEEEQARMHALLQQAQKMEAIGTLAGGIAHDFNNILSVIIGNAELAMPEIDGASPARYSLDQIVKAGYRARDLVGQILAFSRMSERERKPIRLGSIAKEVLKFLRASLPSTIEIRRAIHAKQDTILADPTQIHQVLMNLCTNASHAMQEEGGVLELVLDNVDLTSEDVGGHPDLRPGGYLKLSVVDTGCGMSPKVMKRIFEPYFTTKEKGTGTGLGLAVVHGIVKDLGGDIQVQSEIGKGSRFDVLLPLADERAISGIHPHGEQPPRGHERILFVDDEESVVDLGRRMLQHLGYEVEVRTSSVEALETFKAQPDIYDLVITDMTMPRMTGDRLAVELIAIRTGIPIILCTGHSDKISDERAKTLGIRALIMKPIDMHEMAGTARRVLDE